MHHNAKRAVISVALDGMNVSYLDDGQQSQQYKTHHGGHRPASEPGAALSADICLKPCHECIPYIKNTHCWMRSCCDGYQFRPEFDRE